MHRGLHTFLEWALELMASLELIRTCNGKSQWWNMSKERSTVQGLMALSEKCAYGRVSEEGIYVGSVNFINELK